MRIIINRCFGGFKIPETVVELLELNSVYLAGNIMDEENIAIRTDPIFIKFVEEMDEKEYILYEYNHSSALRIVEIPEEATDWEILDYDGMEFIIAVVDGKIKKIYR